jgi:N-acetylglutamate synthase-like GNAT family acetyltransferase
MTAQRTRGLRVAGTVPVISTGASYVRVAREADIPKMVKIIDTYVERRLLLKRTPEEILAQLPSWRVAELDGEVVGCASLTDFGEGLGELLVRAIVRTAERKGISRLFVITKIPRYFARHGFVSLEMDEVPEVLAVDRVPWPRKPGEGHAMELPL